MDAADGGAGLAGEPGQAAAIHVRDSQGVVVGDHAEIINVFRGPGQIARTAYLEQVRDIAPLELRDREAEVGELTAFCAGQAPGDRASAPGSPVGRGSYMWWQAGPWAGKSALMSWLALHPPPGADVVCFFVTARLAAQADSTAFTEALLEQLASLVGEDLPASPATANRDAHRRLLLRTAAQRAHEAGRRLVLVIDGLDEDRSRQSAEGLPSIASLLPRYPEEDLLGVVTASQGGLTLADLESLTGLAPHKIEGILSGVTGRSIMGRATDSGPPVGATRGRAYLLAHETLQAEAIRSLGGSLGCYREKIYHWAAGYRLGHWPEDTPAYLLRGYPQMLRATGDRARLTRLALDEKRHDRMLSSLGGDGAALAEVTAAQEMAAATADPDFAALLGLAARRDDLLARNESVPAVLPLVWARLGYPVRAEALARSIGDPASRACSLTRLATLLAEAGEHEQVRRLAPDAIAAARSAGDADVQGQLLLRLVRATVSTGDFDLTAAAAPAITDPWWRADAVTVLAEALAAAGRHDDAIAAAGAIEDAATRAALITHLLRACPRTLSHDTARSAYEQAASAAASVTADEERARALADIAAAVTAVGLPDVTSQAVARATAAARQLADPGARDEALADLAIAVIAAGGHGSARDIASAITDPCWRAQALARLTAQLAASGCHAEARATAGDALLAAGAIGDASWQAEEIGDLVRVLSSAGMPGLAITAAESIRDAHGRATALCDLGISLARSGDHRHAERTLAPAISSALLASGQAGQADAWPRLVRLLAAAGDVRRSLYAAGLVADPYWRALVLARLVPELLASGDHEPAAEAIAGAESAARAVPDPYWRAQALAGLAQASAPAGSAARASQDTEAEITASAVSAAKSRLLAAAGSELALVPVACALAQSGRTRQAAMVAGAIDDPVIRAEALAEVAEGVAVHDTPLNAVAIITRGISDPWWQARALGKLAALLAMDRTIGMCRGETADSAAMMNAPWTDVVRELPDPGNITRAVAAARSAALPIDQAEALAQLAWALATAGQDAEALRVATEAEAVARAIPDGGQRGTGLADLVEALCLAGEAGQARSVAGAIPDEDTAAKALALARVLETMVTAYLYEEALSTARMMPTVFWALRREAARLARAGEHRYAIEIAGLILISPERDSALDHVARELAVRGDGAQSIASAQAISSHAGRARSVARLAEPLARAGQDEHANRAATAAVSAAKLSASLRAADDVLMTLLSAGTHHQTISIARLTEEWAGATEITEQEKKAYATLGEAARAMASGDYRHAIRAANNMSASKWEASLIFATIRWLAAAGDRQHLHMAVEASIDIARKETTGATWVNPNVYLFPLAHLLADVGYGHLLDRTRLGFLVSNPPPRSAAWYENASNQAYLESWRNEHARLLADAAKAPATNDNAEPAERTARAARNAIASATDASPKIKGMIAASQAKHEAKARERERRAALDAVSAATSENADGKLASAIRALLRVAERQEAIAVARDISQPRHRATALSAIAEILAGTGDTATARRLALEALLTGPWTTPLRTVARLAPQALSSFATERLAKLND